MKNFIRFTATAFFVVIFSGLHAQVSSSSTVSAEVVQELTLTLENGTGIDFGNLSASTTGDVVLDANGSGGNVNTGSQTSVARFNLTGANQIVTVSFDESVTLTETVEGTATMTMTPEVAGNISEVSQSSATEIISGSTITPSSSAYYFWVGGTIPQLSNQATGTYEGSFTIEVEYQ